MYDIKSNLVIGFHGCEAAIRDELLLGFFEGGPAFEGSGIFAKTHIQICIRNPDCIKGFFKPRVGSSLSMDLK